MDRMKSMRLIALVLAIVVVCSVFAGCKPTGGKDVTTTAPTQSTTLMPGYVDDNSTQAQTEADSTKETEDSHEQYRPDGPIKGENNNSVDSLTVHESEVVGKYWFRIGGLGKAFDCRIGCAVVLETMRRLAGKKLNLDVVGTLSSQEEIGERGAKVAVDHVKPAIAIVFEGAPADDTFMPEYKIQTGLHRGPMLRHMDRSMITNPRFIRYAIDTAEELGIPVQEAVRSGGGTNGAMIHVANGGVPTIVLSVPVRYTHSHHCYTAMDDFEKAVQLSMAIVEKLDAETIQGF